MVEKMKFLSITGPKEDIDRVVDQYLSKHEIQLENALSELKTVKNLRPYTETNPYKEEYQISKELFSTFGSRLPASPAKDMNITEAAALIHSLNEELTGINREKNRLLGEISTIQASLDKITPFDHLNYDLKSILEFRFVKFRFGRMSREYYEKFQDYVYDTLDTILHKCSEDNEYVWLVYFVPDTLADKIDAIYASMHFERFFMPDEYEGTPSEAVRLLQQKIDGLEVEVTLLNQQIAGIIDKQKEDLAAACQRLETYVTNFNVRKLAACTQEKERNFYIICGWMAEKDAAAFEKEIEEDENAFVFIEEDHGKILSKPPTRLKNPKLFKPFEMFIEMYGLPAYEEWDPSILLGLTYSFLFGFMFGDVGQGLCLLVGGFLLYRSKKMNLAAIISCCGFFSAIFGLLFGSVFGFETIIEPLWLHPKSAITKLPFIGNLNTVFIVAIALGMGIIMLAMVLNIIGNIKRHNVEHAFFDTNGIAGLVFYASAFVMIVLFMSGHQLPAAGILAVMFIIPLFIIFLKEPLAAIVEKKAEVMPKEKGMFIVQGFFELFEILLSYFSNTLSFVRVGAFAVSHAAMMEVVLMLAGAEAGNPNWLVIILGNLFVCGMEGLIVGIQVLRLEYYELFSRFYHGTGRPFKPYGKESQI